MTEYDLIVIGSGPAGQKAAIQAAKAGKKVALIERDRVLGGACVHRGTIPSKTLKENALRVRNMRQNAQLANFQLNESMELSTLIDRLDLVLKAHDHYMKKHVEQNEINRIHGRAEFVDAHSLLITPVRETPYQITADKIIIAAGSIPRLPNNIPIDHEHIFDSDSILSMLYLPKSLTVLGGGVIASEYASIFQALGVKVTMIDKYPLPLGFLDSDLTATFVDAFQDMGGTWMGGCDVVEVKFDGISSVLCTTKDGQTIRSEKLLCAAGRVANIDDLKIDNAGLTLNERGHLPVNEHLQTPVSHIYAAGDVIGPPSLASASMEQGRRASCNAFGLPLGQMGNLIPSGIYGIPELSAVGLTEDAARKEYGDGIFVGKANYGEIARGLISGSDKGMLKIICADDGHTVLGVQIVGEGATELIHIGQMAIMGNMDVDFFIESIFNFPTMAEAYRVAALQIYDARHHKRPSN